MQPHITFSSFASIGRKALGSVALALVLAVSGAPLMLFSSEQARVDAAKYDALIEVAHAADPAPSPPEDPALPGAPQVSDGAAEGGSQPQPQPETPDSQPPTVVVASGEDAALEGGEAVEAPEQAAPLAASERSSNSAGAPADADGSYTTTNLVVLVRFKGDATGEGDTGFNKPYGYKPTVGTEWQALMYEYNGGLSYFSNSMKGYFDAVSGGRERVGSFFPQTLPSGRVEYIDMPQDYDYYATMVNDYSFVQDAVDAFNAKYPDFDASALDADGNGTADNVTFLATVATPTTSRDRFWPHMYHLQSSDVFIGSTATRKRVEITNIMDTGNIVSGTVGLASHEYMHSLGAMDYYRAQPAPGRPDPQPVGPWDIMSLTRASLIWPLAQTRQDLGWGTIPEQAQSGTITLHAPSSGKQQSLSFKTSLSDEEYFVVEYRKKAPKYSTDLDSGIGGSGLIVYRVNPAFKQWGNQGKDDYIYVFRPGETGLGHALGQVDRAQVSMPGTENFSRQSIGSADSSATVQGGAIVYSDGRNSGAVIDALSQTDDSITFNLALPAPPGDDEWSTVPNAAGPSSLGTQVSSISTANDGQTLFAGLRQWGNSAEYQMMAYANGSWGALGGPIPAGDLGSGTIAVHDGTLYFAASDFADGSNNGLRIKRWVAATSSWEDVAFVSTGRTFVGSLAIKSVAGSLYAIVGTQGSNPAPQVYRLEGDGLVAVGGSLPVAAISSPALVEVGGRPAVACGDSRTGTTTLYRFDGSAWQATSLGSVGASFIDATSSGNTAYVLADSGANGAPALYTVGPDGGLVGSVELPWLAGGHLGAGASLGAHGSYLYATTVEPVGFDGGPVKTFAIPRSGITGSQADWQQVGGTVFAPAIGASMTIMGGTIYVGAINAQTSTAPFRSRSVLSEPTVISVTMPTSASFSVAPDAAGDPSAQISGPDDLKVTNNSAIPVWVNVTGVRVQGVSLVDAEAGLAAPSTLMLALSDRMPTDFGTPVDWLPASAPDSPAVDVRYIPFNRDQGGMIPAASGGTGVDSPIMRLYGKASSTWPQNAAFSVTPTFTVTASDPRSGG